MSKDIYSEKEEVLAALREVWEWIDNWVPDFVCDDEWPELEARVNKILDR